MNSIKGKIAYALVLSLACGLFGYFGATHATRNAKVTTVAASDEAVMRAEGRFVTYTDSLDNKISDIVPGIANSVVEISTESVSTGITMRQYISEGAGSGVIVTVDGYIVTNNHVIEDANKITVRLRNGASYEAKLIGTDPQTDIAVIKIEENNLEAAKMGDSATLKVGELAIAIGNPLGQLGGTVTDGIISALDREITIDNETMTLLQTSASINPGNSGGGLFNAKGELIGIVNAKSSGSDIEGLGFAIPINIAKKIVDDIMAYGYVKGRVDDGLTLVEINDYGTARMYRVQTLGVYISEVTSESAKSAGFTSGDIIIAVNGVKISSSYDYETIIRSKNIGDTVSVEIQRQGQNSTINLVLTEENNAQLGRYENGFERKAAADTACRRSVSAN